MCCIFTLAAAVAFARARLSNPFNKCDKHFVCLHNFEVCIQVCLGRLLIPLDTVRLVLPVYRIREPVVTGWDGPILRQLLLVLLMQHLDQGVICLVVLFPVVRICVGTRQVVLPACIPMRCAHTPHAPHHAPHHIVVLIDIWVLIFVCVLLTVLIVICILVFHTLQAVLLIFHHGTESIQESA